MRLDEFSLASEMDGTLEKQEQMRFLLVGFDLVGVEVEAPAFDKGWRRRRRQIVAHRPRGRW